MFTARNTTQLVAEIRSKVAVAFFSFVTLSMQTSPRVCFNYDACSLSRARYPEHRLERHSSKLDGKTEAVLLTLSGNQQLNSSHA